MKIENEKSDDIAAAAAAATTTVNLSRHRLLRLLLTQPAS